MEKMVCTAIVVVISLVSVAIANFELRGSITNYAPFEIKISTGHTQCVLHGHVPSTVGAGTTDDPTSVSYSIEGKNVSEGGDTCGTEDSHISLAFTPVNATDGGTLAEAYFKGQDSSWNHPVKWSDYDNDYYTVTGGNMKDHSYGQTYNMTVKSK